MDNKITLSALAAMIALSSGKQKDLCEDFVRELFSIVGEELAKGENVRIKGFGTFKLVAVEPRKSINIVTGESHEIPGHTKVIFVMAKELAALVNAPFNAFEAVEIADELPSDLLEGDVDVFSEEGEVATEAVEEPVAESKAETEETEPELKETEEPELKEAEEPEPKQKSEVATEAEEPEALSGEDVAKGEEPEYYGKVEGDYEEREEEEEAPISFWKRYKFIIGFLSGVCASILIGWLAICLADYLKQSSENHEEVAVAQPVEIKEDPVSVVDSIATVSEENDAVPTQPSDAPVYDTVTTTRYLTTIAKEHYGNFNLWPIIYEENASILGHPDRIRPGTQVVVPPLSKYNVDPQDPEQIKAIKKKGNEIYGKFK